MLYHSYFLVITSSQQENLVVIGEISKVINITHSLAEAATEWSS